MSEVRAGGTDLGERRRSGVSRGPVVDLGRRPELSAVDWSGTDGGATIGALVTIAELAADARIGAGYPGLAAAAEALATPQIRRVATVGGNLLQRNRCWYFRHPATSCLKKGGTDCPARSGNHRYGVLFDLGPCVAPHPSTLGTALLAYGAMVATDRRAALSVAEVFGDGSDGTHDHLLDADELLTRVTLPPPVPGEHAAYFRATSRAYAEWPLVEAVVRLRIDYGEGDGSGNGGVGGDRRRRRGTGSTPPAQGRGGPCRSAGHRGSVRGCSNPRGRGRQPVAHDRLQGRPARRHGHRGAGARRRHRRETRLRVAAFTSRWGSDREG